MKKTICAAPLAAALLLLGATFPAYADTSGREVKYLQRGVKLFEQGEYEKARLEFKNAARIKPTDPEAFYRIGLVDEARGDLRNAFTAFIAAERQDAAFRPVLLKLAQYFIAAEQYGEAEARLGAVLSQDAADPEAHALRAALLLRYKDYERCAAEAREALARDPANLTAISVLTGLYIAQGNTDRAEAVVAEGIRQHPREASLQQLKIALYGKLDRLSGIEEGYRALFKLRPDDVRYRFDLADIYVKHGDISAAEGVLRGGVTSPESDWPVKQRLVSFLSEHRGLEAAEAEVRLYLSQAPKKDDLFFWLADLYIRHGAVDRAVDLLRQIAARNEFQPPGMAAQVSLARISFARGDRLLTERLIAAVLDKAPTNRQALYLRAQIAFQRGQYQNTVTDLRAILRETANIPEVLSLLAEALLMQGRLDLAIDTLAHLVEVAPTDPVPRVRLAQLYNVNNDPARAVETLVLVTRADPACAVAWESLARVKLSQKDIAGAIDAIDHLAAIEGQRLTAQFLRGQARVVDGRLDDAIRLFSGVITPDPAAPLAGHALTALIDAHARQGRPDAAIRFIESLRSDDPLVVTTLGELFLQRGQRDKAVAAFDRAVDKAPDTVRPYVARARLYLLEGKTDAAIAVIRRGIDTVTNTVPLALLLADVYDRQGSHKEALAVYDGLLADDPGLDVAANNAAELIADHQYQDTSALERARQLAERFQATSNPLSLDTLAWVYYRKGDKDKALQLAGRVLAAERLPPQAHYHVGMILLAADRKAEAKAMLLKAVEGSPSYPGIDEARRVLQTL